MERRFWKGLFFYFDTLRDFSFLLFLMWRLFCAIFVGRSGSPPSSVNTAKLLTDLGPQCSLCSCQYILYMRWAEMGVRPLLVSHAFSQRCLLMSPGSFHQATKVPQRCKLYPVSAKEESGEDVSRGGLKVIHSFTVWIMAASEKGPSACLIFVVFLAIQMFSCNSSSASYVCINSLKGSS